MKFICPTCNKELPRELRIIIPHTEEHIMEAIKRKHPDWVKKNGVCKECYKYYKKALHSEK